MIVNIANANNKIPNNEFTKLPASNLLSLRISDE